MNKDLIKIELNIKFIRIFPTVYMSEPYMLLYTAQLFVLHFFFLRTLTESQVFVPGKINESIK